MSWYLNENDILKNDSLPDSLPTGFNYPYPATFWSLNNKKVLTLFLLPKPVGGDDVGAWYLDENDILKNIALPEQPLLNNIYADLYNINMVMLGDIQIQKIYIGDISILPPEA